MSNSLQIIVESLISKEFARASLIVLLLLFSCAVGERHRRECWMLRHNSFAINIMLMALDSVPLESSECLSSLLEEGRHLSAERNLWDSARGIAEEPIWNQSRSCGSDRFGLSIRMVPRVKQNISIAIH
jgi:hypothetical protein